MTKEEAAEKVCPFMSGAVMNHHTGVSYIEHQLCLTDQCIAWRETINSQYSVRGRCMRLENAE